MSRHSYEALASQEEDLRPYFSLPRVLDGLFSLVTRLFDVEIVAADGKAPVWDKDVRFFQINRNSQPIAYFYLDPYSVLAYSCTFTYTLTYIHMFTCVCVC